MGRNNRTNELALARSRLLVKRTVKLAALRLGSRLQSSDQSPGEVAVLEGQMGRPKISIQQLLADVDLFPGREALPGHERAAEPDALVVLDFVVLLFGKSYAVRADTPEVVHDLWVRKHVHLHAPHVPHLKVAVGRGADVDDGLVPVRPVAVDLAGLGPHRHVLPVVPVAALAHVLGEIVGVDVGAPATVAAPPRVDVVVVQVRLVAAVSCREALRRRGQAPARVAVKGDGRPVVAAVCVKVHRRLEAEVACRRVGFDHGDSCQVALCNCCRGRRHAASHVSRLDHGGRGGMNRRQGNGADEGLYTQGFEAQHCVYGRRRAIDVGEVYFQEG